MASALCFAGLAAVEAFLDRHGLVVVAIVVVIDGLGGGTQHDLARYLQRGLSLDGLLVTFDNNRSRQCNYGDFTRTHPRENR